MNRFIGIHDICHHPFPDRQPRKLTLETLLEPLLSAFTRPISMCPSHSNPYIGQPRPYQALRLQQFSELFTLSNQTQSIEIECNSGLSLSPQTTIVALHVNIISWCLQTFSHSTNPNTLCHYSHIPPSLSLVSNQTPGTTCSPRLFTIRRV